MKGVPSLFSAGKVFPGRETNPGSKTKNVGKIIFPTFYLYAVLPAVTPRCGKLSERGLDRVRLQKLER